MNKGKNFRDFDNIFEALANQHRREIVYLLSLQPHSISQLAAARNLSLPAIHKHIKILEKGGLVIRKKIGRTYFLALNREALISLQEWMSQFQAYWGNGDESLDNYLQYLNRDQ